MAAENEAAADSFGDWEQVHLTTSTTTNETSVSDAATPINGDEILPPPPLDEDGAGGGETRSARVRLRMEVLKSGMIGVVQRVLRRCSGGGALWSCLVVAAAVLMYVKLVKWRRWVREETASRFALLIKEKDEKIRQLMSEIVKMKQMLIAARGSRVHVFRFYQSRDVGL